MKKILVFIMCLFSFTCFAATSDRSFNPSCTGTGPCPDALPTNNPGFCASFIKAAQCQCSVRGGLPPAMCQDMGKIYSRMIAVYKSVPAACAAQKDAPTQTCIDDWVCYLNGGKDSLGRACSSTGRAC